MSVHVPTDRAWVDVDLDALVANARRLASCVGKPLVPMVKANAYGLGAVTAARALEAIAPWGFGIATPAEALELRAAGIGARLISFSSLLPRWIPAVREAGVRPSIGDPSALRAWRESGGGPFHLELDTGMSRGGIRWDDAAALALIRDDLGDECEGLYTHCYSSEADAASVVCQYERLQEVAAGLPVRPPLVHLANSAVSLNQPALAGDLARPGIFLYGGGTFGPAGSVRPLPVATLRARVLSVRLVRAGGTVSYGATWEAMRDTRVATIGIGYADGVPRSLSNRGQVELGGRVVPVIGRVTMDMLMVAVPDDLLVAPDDVATIFGGRIPLEAQAAAAGTLSYELLTSLGTRVPRRYGTS